MISFFVNFFYSNSLIHYASNSLKESSEKQGLQQQHDCPLPGNDSESINFFRDITDRKSVV